MEKTKNKPCNLAEFEDFGEWEECISEREFTLEEDETIISKTIAEFIKERGKGYFASSEY